MQAHRHAFVDGTAMLLGEDGGDAGTGPQIWLRIGMSRMCFWPPAERTGQTATQPHSGADRQVKA